MATARIWWQSTVGHEQTAATVCRDSRSIGSGSISDNRFVLAVHRSGTDGRDVKCCGVEAPSWPASRCCRGRFAGVTLRVITTGETASCALMSISDPVGSVASGMSRGGDNSIKLPSDEASSQSATAASIWAMSDCGCTDVTNDASNNICSWSTAAQKNRRRGACSGLLVTMYAFLSS